MTGAVTTAGALRGDLVRRGLFVATILAGSFLLFLIQPMVARMALPRLGGAPAVWNSAMLVYQALLLAGYGYAHWLGRFPVRRQATIHLVVLAVASLWLPVGLANLSAPGAGQEAWWVPVLLTASIGPIFFAVSAQAPLMQRWFAAHDGAGDPYALYAASNIGSFAGLLSYPILFEPLTSLETQGWGWAVGYALLFGLVAACAWARWQGGAVDADAGTAAAARPTPRRMLHWLLLAAVPSGLMLSTTTHLTTDIFAMPLLWVIPLGLYLLSFTIAFSERRGLVEIVLLIAPAVLLVAGGLSLVSVGIGSLFIAGASLLMLFVVAIALHAHLYHLRPAPAQLTLFYFVMSAGGVLGGLFAALLAPVLFDWVYEHPLLVLAAAMLIPMPKLIPWAEWLKLSAQWQRIGALALLLVAVLLALRLMANWNGVTDTPILLLIGGTMLCGILLTGYRWAYVLVLAMLMIAIGGVDTLRRSAEGDRTRSYFGVYTVRDMEQSKMRSLAHGTTLHGMQHTDPAREREATTYYGPTSGVGLTLSELPRLYGPDASVGIVGLGTGTLACYAKPGQNWTFFEIDPAMVTLARDSGLFTFMPKCAADSRILVGDARLELEKLPAASFDVLAIDAFSSDAIPLHLLTSEAISIYHRALKPGGILLFHISNRFFELEPVLAVDINARGWSAAIRRDMSGANDPSSALTPSVWVAISDDPARLKALTGPLLPRAVARDTKGWSTLRPRPGLEGWTDDYASILPVFHLSRKTGD